MSKFADCLGREWTLRLTLGHRAGLKERGVDTKDLPTALAGLTAVTAAVDMEAVYALVEVVRLLTVEPTGDDYADGWDADTIVRAGEALAEAVSDFFLSRRPKMAAALMTRVKAVWDQMDEQAAGRLSDPSTSSPSATS